MNAPTQKKIDAAIEAQRPVAGHRNVFTALAAAQTEFSAVIKGASNPAFRSKYADLSAVVEAVAPALSRHGIAFYHMTVPLADDLAMRTVLHHGESDTQLSCDVPLIVSKRDMQGFKSATTYAKRIGLESVTGVAPEDDDGNAAAKAAPLKEPAVSRKTVPDEAMETSEGTVRPKGATPYPPNATPAEKAKIAADGIIAEFAAAKTPKGVDGAWDRNEAVLTRLKESYPADHERVVEAYEFHKVRAEDGAA